MLYLYLDESGDLGFDFINKKPSKFFTIAILVVNGVDQNKKLIKAVKKTLGKKLNFKKKNKASELKGKSLTLKIKEYFYKEVRDINFNIYAVTLDKRCVVNYKKNKIYNLVAKKIIDQISFDISISRIEFVIDKSKTKLGIEDFNKGIINQLMKKVNSNISIEIQHLKSNESYGLQACDLFAHGIFLSHEKEEKSWKNIFEKKVVYDGIYSDSVPYKPVTPIL